MAYNKNPNNVTNAVTICGFPKYANIPKYIKVQSSVIIIIPSILILTQSIRE